MAAKHGAHQGRELLDRIMGGYSGAESPLTHVTELPARTATLVPWPGWADGSVVQALRTAGATQPWQHQTDAASRAFNGQHTIVATGTASGKSLCYQLPVLSTLTADPRARALYLSPTKALCADQLRAVSSLDGLEIRVAAYDGDTPMAERDWARAHAQWIFTNPDMLHQGFLATHSRWAHFFRRLAYVVIDECHSYRGVFGSHIALLLRRLRRVAAHYGANPTFILASATTAHPADFAERLTGLSCAPITEDSSPRSARTIALWEPPLLPEASEGGSPPVRRSAAVETARILAELVLAGASSLAFIRSRRGAELTALTTRRILSEVDSSLTRRVAAYRAGFLPEERRTIERQLLSGELLAVAATNALELGIDIAGLDAVLLAGYPGTLASFWQQAGRAGRAHNKALVVFVARDDPLDTYLVHHPAAILNRPVETAVLDPTNPYILAPQLACAAAELPLTANELDMFGGDAAQQVVAKLTGEKVLRRRPRGWYWTSRDRPHGEVDIRGSSGEQIALVEAETARMLGTVDWAAAHHAVHPGAVYLHQGSSYVVDELDLDAGLALVHAESPEWNTAPQETSEVSILATHQHMDHGGVQICLGDVLVSSQVVGFLRRLPSGKIIDRVPLDLPERKLHTRAVWYTISADLLLSKQTSKAPGRAGLEPAQLPGALHAAEHAAIGLLPLFATCDRWDVGGLSTVQHADTGEATVFVHDGHPGGAGFADRGFAALVPWLGATREAIVSCECPAGCPSCVQSPKCGNGNEPLDKAGAVAVLDIVLGAVCVHEGEHGHVAYQTAKAGQTARAGAPNS